MVREGLQSQGLRHTSPGHPTCVPSSFSVFFFFLTRYFDELSFTSIPARNLSSILISWNADRS